MSKRRQHNSHECVIDSTPLALVLEDESGVKGIADSGGLLDRGLTVTVEVPAHGAKRISLAAMLIPTNDAFVALGNARVPDEGSRTVYAIAYDAGSELNDELCANIPAPVCGGDGPSPGAGGEDYVHVHAGIHGTGNLIPAERDWRNPIARITVEPPSPGVDNATLPSRSSTHRRPAFHNLLVEPPHNLYNRASRIASGPM